MYKWHIGLKLVLRPLQWYKSFEISPPRSRETSAKEGWGFTTLIVRNLHGDRFSLRYRSINPYKVSPYMADFVYHYASERAPLLFFNNCASTPCYVLNVPGIKMSVYFTCKDDVCSFWISLISFVYFYSKRNWEAQCIPFLMCFKPITQWLHLTKNISLFFMHVSSNIWTALQHVYAEILLFENIRIISVHFSLK